MLKAKDIAGILGVSTATISLVINNKPGVSDAKRKEILDKIHELGCDHLLHEEKEEWDNIGFVVYKRMGTIVDESPFFSYYLEGITSKLRVLKYNLVILYMNSSMTKEEQNHVLQSAHCAGFIIFAVEMQYEDMQIFKDSRYPFVMLDNSFKINDVDTVAINNVTGIRTAVNYLIQHGHKRIGYISSTSVINAFTERFEAYKDTLMRNGLYYGEDLVAHVRYNDVEARSDMIDFIHSAQQMPTAFVSDNDLVACGAIKGIQDCGLSVPNDISVIGFDDRSIAAMCMPPLTTMAVPMNVFGDECVRMLCSKIGNRRSFTFKLDIGTILVERESVLALS